MYLLHLFKLQYIFSLTLKNKNKNRFTLKHCAQFMVPSSFTYTLWMALLFFLCVFDLICCFPQCGHKSTSHTPTYNRAQSAIP